MMYTYQFHSMMHYDVRLLLSVSVHLVNYNQVPTIYLIRLKYIIIMKKFTSFRPYIGHN